MTRIARHLLREQKAIALYPEDEYQSEEALLADVTEFIEMVPYAKLTRQNAYLRSGISDVHICYYGRFIAAELKDCIGTPTFQQLQYIADIKACGGIAGICRTVKDVYRLMNQVFRDTVSPSEDK